MSSYNVYCDESCHLENDHQKAMVLGAVWCPTEKTKEISVQIREIKVLNGLSRNFEIKWTKVSPAKLDFYLQIINYFFDNKDLHFRALIIPDKSILRHEEFNQDHDTWYYKMYFNLLKVIFSPEDRYRIYLDIKDTWGGYKIRKLHEVLCNSLYDFSQEIVERVQIVRSNELEVLQLTDLLIGAIAAANRGSTRSEAKLRIIGEMQKRSGYQLTKTTLYREMKVNLFRWHPRGEF